MLVLRLREPVPSWPFIWQGLILRIWAKAFDKTSANQSKHLPCFFLISGFGHQTSFSRFFKWLYLQYQALVSESLAQDACGRAGFSISRHHDRFGFGQILPFRSSIIRARMPAPVSNHRRLLHFPERKFDSNFLRFLLRLHIHIHHNPICFPSLTALVAARSSGNKWKAIG